jgi:hypothetical protein
MPSFLTRFRGPLLFLMLLSVTARVFTGAPEAQVNFTSLLVDQNVVTVTKAQSDGLLHGAILKNAGNASSTPDKHRTYVTYKKYVTPDKSLAVEAVSSRQRQSRDTAQTYFNLNLAQKSIYLPQANSPPAVVSAHLLTHTTTADISVVTERNFGEFTIDNSAWGLGSFQL